MAVRLDLIQGSEAWHAARSEGLGSSSLPVIVGESPYQSPLELWAQMTGLVPVAIPDAGTQRLMDIGKRMEPVLLDLYEVETGRKARRVPRMLAHPKYPWARASLDAEAPVKRIVEAKWTHARRWSQGDAVPVDVHIQVQWQMFVAGRDVADVVALVGPELRVVEIERDQSMIDDLFFLAEDFWAHVRDRVQPATDGSESTRQTLARIHPRNDGVLLASDEDIDRLIADLIAAKVRAKDEAAGVGSLENAVRALIGDADGFEGTWGRVTWRKNADSERTDWKSLAAGYREAIDRELAMVESGDLSETALPSREDLEAIVAIHTQTTEGPRVLRLTPAKGGDPE